MSRAGALFGVLFALAVTVKGLEPLKDPDVAWHVATGRWFLEHGSWPQTDPFSHSAFGKPWPIHQAGGALVLALVHQAGGYQLIRGLMLLVIAAFLALIAWQALRRSLTAPVTALLLTLFFFAAQHRFLERPYLFGALCLMALLALWDSVLAGSRRAWVAFALVSLAWTNIHGDYFLGIFTFFLLTPSEKDESRRRRGLAAWVLMLVIWPLHRGGLAMCWYPIEQVVFPELGWGLYVDVVKELKPPRLFELTALSPYLWGLLVMGAWVLGRSLVRRQWTRALLVLVLGVMSVQASRNALPFAVVVCSLACRELGPSSMGWGWALAFLAPGLWHLGTVIPRIHDYSRAQVPSRSVEVVADRVKALRAKGWLKGNLLNEFSLGGGLIGELGERSVFVDGRMDIYGPLFLEHNYAPLTKPEGSREWARIFREHGISQLAWTFSDPSWQPLAGFCAAKGWKVVYMDPTKYVLADPAALPADWPHMGPDIASLGFAPQFSGEPDGAEAVMTLAGMLGRPAEALAIARWMREAYPQRPAAAFFEALMDGDPCSALGRAVGAFPSHAPGRLLWARALLSADPFAAAREAEVGIKGLTGSAQHFAMVLEIARAFKAAGHGGLLEPVLRKAMNPQGYARLETLLR